MRHERLRPGEAIPSYTLTLEFQLDNQHPQLEHPWSVYQVHVGEGGRHALSRKKGLGMDGPMVYIVDITCFQGVFAQKYLCSVLLGMDRQPSTI